MSIIILAVVTQMYHSTVELRFLEPSISQFPQVITRTKSQLSWICFTINNFIPDLLNSQFLEPNFISLEHLTNQISL